MCQGRVDLVKVYTSLANRLYPFGTIMGDSCIELRFRQSMLRPGTDNFNDSRMGDVYREKVERHRIG
jgi:hypothetical protein